MMVYLLCHTKEDGRTLAVFSSFEKAKLASGSDQLWNYARGEGWYPVPAVGEGFIIIEKSVDQEE